MGWQSIKIVGVSACVIFNFAPENAEDSEMYLLVLAYLGCPGQSPESRKMVVCVCVCVCVYVVIFLLLQIFSMDFVTSVALPVLVYKSCEQSLSYVNILPRYVNRVTFS